jgi:hypothetical protein
MECTTNAIVVRFSAYLAQTQREIRKRKCNYALGVMSIFIVVFVAAVCSTLLANAPVIFVQQAELSEGQVDFTFTPADATNMVHSRAAFCMIGFR